MMTYEEALAYIHRHKRFASRPTLDRMRQLMKSLGNPQDQMQFIHVAGTNGKGSTAAMIASVLQTAGYRTGLTVSPYILDFRERMQVNGVWVSEAELASLTEEIRPNADAVTELTEFELVTALAFQYFARKGCQVVVAEVGLGGRYDATNVIRPPLVPVITRIGLDHTAVLGDTVEQIAAEKAAIIKAGCGAAVSAPGQPVGALASMLEQCGRTGCALIQPTIQAAEAVRLSLDGTDLVYNGFHLHIPLPGRHQVDNALTAFTVCERLAEQGFRPVIKALEQGIANTRFPARMEVVRKEPLVMVDGAHNPDGAAALSDGLKLAGDVPLIGLMGMLSDKDSGSALRLLAPKFNALYCVTPQSPRALPAESLAEQAKQWCKDVRVCGTVEEACEQGVAEASRRNCALVVCGSLYLAAEARKFLKI